MKKNKKIKSTIFVVGFLIFGSLQNLAHASPADDARAEADRQLALANQQNANSISDNGVAAADAQNKYRLAKASEKKDTGGAGSNAMISALMQGAAMACTAVCSTPPNTCTPGCIPLYMMGALAGAQSGHDGSGAGGAYDTGLRTITTPNFTYTPPKVPPGTNPDPGSHTDPSDPENPFYKIPPTTLAGPFGTVGKIQGMMKANSAKMKALGYRVNADGSVTSTKDGVTMTPQQISAAAATGAGLNPGDSQKVKDILAKAAESFEAYKVAAMDMDDSGGAGGGGSGGSAYKFTPYDSKFDMSKYLKGMGDHKPASVAGFSKNLGGEMIGVAGDDIFQMVHRRYQAKEQINYFLGK